jgi:DNA-binding NtrC family response regulator
MARNPGGRPLGLLRALERSEVQRLGGRGTIPVNVRVLASCTSGPAYGSLSAGKAGEFLGTAR